MKHCNYVAKNKFSINLAEMQVIFCNCSVHPKINVKFQKEFTESCRIIKHSAKSYREVFGMEKMFNQMLQQMKELTEQLQYQSIQLQQQSTQLQQQTEQLTELQEM